MVVFRTGIISQGYGALFLLQSLGGIVLSNSLMQQLKLQSNILSYIGENSMIYFCSHWVFIVTTMFSLEMFGGVSMTKAFWIILAIIFCCVPLLIILIQKFNIGRLLGQK